MGQIEDVIKITRRIESLLKQFGAKGRGMHELITSIESQLSQKEIRILRKIASIRNKTLHNNGYYIKDMNQFIQLSQSIIDTLKIKLKKVKKECFIAVVIYKSYNDSKIIFLRSFRDNYLMQNIFGRLFVRLYYLVSPLFLRWLSKRPKTVKKIRKLLNSLIKYLKKNPRFTKRA